jgi:hypothetical protein
MAVLDRGYERHRKLVALHAALAAAGDPAPVNAAS